MAAGAGAGAALSHVAWLFYAMGPQLVLCLVLAYYGARRSGGSLMTWLVVGFLLSVIPIAGVVGMAVLLHLASKQTETP